MDTSFLISKQNSNDFIADIVFLTFLQSFFFFFKHDVPVQQTRNLQKVSINTWHHVTQTLRNSRQTRRLAIRNNFQTPVETGFQTHL